MEETMSSISYRSKNIVRFDVDLMTGGKGKAGSVKQERVDRKIPTKIIQPDEFYDDKQEVKQSPKVKLTSSLTDENEEMMKAKSSKISVIDKDYKETHIVPTTPIGLGMLSPSRSLSKQVQILPDLEEDSGREDDDLDIVQEIPKGRVESSLESDVMSHESEEDWESNSGVHSGSGMTDSDYEMNDESAVIKNISRPYSEYLKRFQKLKATLEKWNTFLSQNNNNGAMTNNKLEFDCDDDRHEDDNAHQQQKRRISENRESLKEIFYEFKHLASRHQAGFLAISGDNPLQRFDNNGHNIKKVELTHRETMDRYHATEVWARKQSARRRLEQDAVSLPEEAHLKQKLRNLSSELVTLRNSLHVNNNGQQQQQTINGSSSQQQSINIANNANNTSSNNISHGNMSLRIPSYNPSQVLGGQQQQHSSHHENYSNKPLPPHPPNPHHNNNHHQNNNNNNNNHNNNNHNNSNLNHNSNNNLINSSHHNVHHNNNNHHNNSSNGYYVNQNFPKGDKDVMRVNGNGGDGNQSEDKAFGSLIGTVTTNSASGGDATPSESSFKLLSSSTSGSGVSAMAAALKVRLTDIEDLIHLYGPLTEDSLIRCLQARCEAAKYYVHMGQIVLMLNPLNTVGNPLTLSSTKELPTPPPIQKIVQEALRQERDTSTPQAIILSGVSGSGKTHTSMLVLRQLFEQAGGGVDTDAFKRVEASITVLRSLGTARTALNAESSRIGHFFDVSVTDGAVYRTKVHCYFLDQSRVVRRAPGDRNYHIFYQMLAGLNPEERALLNLGEHTVRTLRYLRSSVVERPGEEAEDARRFLDWKASLEVLGITFMEVVRVLTSVILIGNVQFVDSACGDLEIEGSAELQAAADLLGVSDTALRQGLTTRTHNVRNQLVRSRCDANLSNFSRDALAKSLYCRTVSTIVRRANNVRRLTSTAGTLSSDSTDSVHNQAETQSQHASTVGTAGSKASKSMTALNNAVRRSTDGCIGILDMFGFEDVKPSHLEHLCINLCAEAMQHFYNTQIFKTPMEACRDEGIRCDWEVEYMGNISNIPCIDLVSTLRTGLLNMLDIECEKKGTVESYVQKVRLQHNENPRLLETKAADFRSFGIQHYAGKVYYNATEFLDTNRDVVADDIVAVFHKHTCSFGFASHLFSTELKILGAGGMEPSARGISFRISHASCSVLIKGDEPASSLTHDFHDRLNNLLQSLVQFRPHFIRCIKINNLQQHDMFDRHTVSRQLRAFQVLETINFMANGYPHRMRFKLFNARYRLLAPFHQLSRTDDRATEDCQLILECVDNSLDDSVRERLGHVSISWALGKRHVFMSEGARQQLEALRIATRNRAATIIQSTWRGSHCRKRWSYYRHQSGYHPRYQHQSSSLHGPPTMSLQSAAMLHGNVNAAVVPPNQGHLMSSNHHQPQNNVNLSANVNTIYRNGVIVSSAAASSLGNLHTMQATSHVPHNIPSGPLGVHHEPIVPFPAPRNVALNGNSTGPNSGLTSPPAIPSMNTTSVATISIVNSASGGVNSSNGIIGGRPRPQPISGTPPPDTVMERCDPKLVQQTCNLFGLDMERPPPLPPSRSYTVAGNTKLGYPQTRVMKMTFPDEGTATEFRLLKSETVVVVGSSARRGHLLVEYKNRNIHVPYQYLELKPPEII